MKEENRFMAAAVLLPLLVKIFFVQEGGYKLTIGRFAALGVLAAAYHLFLYVRKVQWERRKTALLYSMMCLFVIGVMDGICFRRQNGGIGEGMTACLGLLLAAIVLAGAFLFVKGEKGVSEKVIWAAVFAAFLIRIFYVVMTRSHLFQNDLAGFNAEGYGHLGYTYFLFTDGKLPDLNPMEYYELYQPPLHYAVSAVYLRIFEFLGMLPKEQSEWGEALQILPLAYSMMTMVFITKIGKRMKLSAQGRLAVVCFAGFLPYSIMLSGSLNNDPLAVLLMVMCIYYTFKWYEKPDIKGILIMALCIGLAMMTKISTALIAPAMAVMMLYRAWIDRKQWMVYVKQFACFGLIAFPLGLWHSVYNFVKYEVPLGYAAFLGEDSAQYIGQHDKWARFFDFDRAFEFLAVRLDYIHDFADYNIPVTLIKFATFGESSYYDSSLLTNILGTGIFWADAALFVFMAAALVFWCFRKDGRGIQKTFLLTGAAVSLYSYLKFCIKYTHVCTMNVRYIMGAFYIGCLVIGGALTAIQEMTSKKGAAAGRAGAVGVKAVTVVSVVYGAAVITLLAGMEVLLP